MKFPADNQYLISIEKAPVHRRVPFDLPAYIHIINLLLGINECIEYITIHKLDWVEFIS
ncbi:hypothetical protein PIL02S_01827 [Paenibacillus illinoisensis]|uniref:Uncharacterized protein n=1 Tax=Paenibacillus illinoisensis TaxID=59845 RepID=A0A2W0CD04_9BACL|nr:hypothetical protein PIL02S_01827 [Paenibacillus illinoisensis]